MSAGCDYFIMEESCDCFDMIEYVQSFDMGINFLLGPPTPSEVVFIPSVDADGWLSWTNDGGLPNPEPVNIKGPPGSGGGDVESVNGQTGVVVLTSVDIGLGNVANERQYSANNPPPYPVTSVDGQTGAVALSYYGANNPPPYPVTSVNGKNGQVSLDAADVGAVAKTGDTMTGNLTVQKAGDTSVYVENTTPANAHKVALNAGVSGRGGIWDSTHNKWLVDYDLSGILELGGVKFNKTENLTITRTENVFATATAVGRLSAHKKNGILFLNGNLQLTTGASASSFVEIATISGWDAVFSTLICVPAQGSTGSDPVVTVYLTSSGSLQIYAPNAITSNDWYRFAVSVPTSD